jgi:hypothetical protein
MPIFGLGASIEGSPRLSAALSDIPSCTSEMLKEVAVIAGMFDSIPELVYSR